MTIESRKSVKRNTYGYNEKQGSVCSGNLAAMSEMDTGQLVFRKKVKMLRAGSVEPAIAAA